MRTLFTIGYERTDIERFVRTLQAAGIRQVADLRAVAISRKAGFSKKKLSARLAENGIHYRHFAPLGTPKPGRDAARAQEFDRFAAIYETHLKTDIAKTELENLLDFVQADPTYLLCFERDYKICHRNIVGHKILDMADFGIFHLFADNPDRYARNPAKLPRFHSGESATAA